MENCTSILAIFEKKSAHLPCALIRPDCGGKKCEEQSQLLYLYLGDQFMLSCCSYIKHLIDLMNYKRMLGYTCDYNFPLT